MNVDKRLKSVLKVILPLFIGITLLWVTYRKMDFHSITHIIKSGVNYPVIIGSLFLGIGANILRGLRWQILIEPLIAGEPHTKKSNAVYTTLGSYAVNMALPRAGEIWRCVEMGRYEKISFSRLLGTLFVERIIDLLIIGIILLSIFIGAGQFFSEFFSKNSSITEGFSSIFGSIWFYLGIVVLGTAIGVIYRYLVRKKPEHRITSFINKLLDGLKSIVNMKKRTLFIAYSLLIWIGYFFYFYVTFFAFSFTGALGLSVGLIAFAMGSLAVIVPVQGGVGPWHFMVISALVAFGVAKDDAGAFALIVHTIQSLGTVIAGFIGIFLLPLTNKDYIRVSA